MSIKVDKLSHIYHRGTPLETKAIEDISFEIDRGEWFSIVGHTGSGKSTLAQHLNALLTPHSGRVVVDDIEVGVDKKDLRKIRREVGLVFQYPEQQLFAETVREELLFGPANWEMSIDESRLKDIISLVGLDPSYLDRSPFKLSGGEKRRVAIASVLAVEPSYLVLDEPTAGLDAVGKNMLIELLKKVHKAGKTVIMVTHDMEIALSMSDRLIAMESGHIASVGKACEIGRALREKPIKGLQLPELFDFWLTLEERGLKVPFSWNLNEFTKNISRLVVR